MRNTSLSFFLLCDAAASAQRPLLVYRTKAAKTESPSRTPPACAIEASFEADGLLLLLADAELELAAEAVDEPCEAVDVVVPEDEADEAPGEDEAAAVADDFAVLLAVEAAAVAVAQIEATADSMAEEHVRGGRFRQLAGNTHHRDHSGCTSSDWSGIGSPAV